MLYPLKAGALCTARRARIITLGLLALAALYNSPRWFELRNVRMPPAPANGTTATVVDTAAAAAVGVTMAFVASNATGGGEHQQQQFLLLVANDSLVNSQAFLESSAVAVVSEEHCEILPAEVLKNRLFVLMYYSWLYTVFKGLMPISLLAILNALLVVRVRRSCRIRKRFTFTSAAADRCSMTNAGGGLAGPRVSLAASALLVHSMVHRPLSIRLSDSKSALPLLKVMPVLPPGTGVRFVTQEPATANGKKPSATSTTSTELDLSTRGSSRKRHATAGSQTADTSARASPTSPAGRSNSNGLTGSASGASVKCERSSGSFAQHMRPPAMNMNYSVTIMLAAIVAVFVVCQLPCVVYNFAFAMDRNYVTDDFRWQLLSLLRNFTGTLQSAVNFILFCLLGKHFRALLMKRFPLLRSAYEIFADCAATARATSYRSRNRETSTEPPAPARVGCAPVPVYNPRSSVELPSHQSHMCRDCRPTHHCIQQHATYLAPLPCVYCERPMDGLFIESRGGDGAQPALGDGRMSRSCIDVSEVHHCIVYYRSPPSSPFPSTSGPNF